MDKPFTVTSRTVGIHGVTDDDLEQHVEHATSLQKLTLRLRDLAARLRELPRVHDEARDTYGTSDTPLRSPAYDQRRSGKPGPRVPSEPDGRIRASLVRSAQHLAQALRVAAHHDWLESPAWHPETLQRSIVVMREPHVAVPLWTQDGEPEWRDPEDFTAMPVDINPGVSQLRGCVAKLLAELQDLDDYDLDGVKDLLEIAEQSVKVVKSLSTWGDTVMPRSEERRCEVDGCDTVAEWGNKTQRDKCARHRQQAKRGAA